MKTLYLHIGMPKTGTSSIQRFLIQNKTVLEEHGFCFPKLPYQYPLIFNNRNAYFMIGKQYHEDGTRDKELEKEYLKEGMAAICQYFEVYDHVILSEETLWRAYKTHAYLFPYLKKHARNHGYQIRIIVYLRRQDEFQLSLWKQNVKHPKTAQTLPFELRLKQVLAEEPFILQYASRLDDMAAIFGKENLIVRRYDRSDWKNGSIIDDFLDCIGLEHTPEYEELPRNMNPSLSENLAQIKRIINKDLSFSQEENAYFSQLMRGLSSESSALYPCSMLSVEETRALLEKFEDENALAAQKYIGDGKPLFSDRIKELPKWQPDNPYMQEDLIRLFAAAVVDLRRENQSLREELTVAQDIARINSELYSLQSDMDKLQETLKNEQYLLRMLKFKLKHPLRALFTRIFRSKKEASQSAAVDLSDPVS